MKIRKTLFVVFVLALMVCLSSITVFSATANDEIIFSASEIESTISDSYSLNQEVDFPSSVTIKYKDADYTATDGIIQYPSGLCYSISTHVLSETGKYAAKYFFEAEGGVYVTATIEFSVKLTYFGFDLSDGSKVTTSATGGEPIDNSGNGSQDHDSTFYTTKVGGLKVDIKEGNTFRVNVPLDLNKINISDLNSSSIVQFTHVGASYVDNVLPVFAQNGADAFSIGNVDPKTGEVIADDTAIVTEIFSGSSSVAPKIALNLPESVDGKGIYIEVFAYNKAKSYLGKMAVNGNGETKVLGNKTWTFTSYKSYNADFYSDIAYIRAVFKYADSRTLTEQDRLDFAGWVNPYRTVFTKTAGSAVVRITDAYDPSVYIELTCYTSAEGYTRGRSNSQEERGFWKLNPTQFPTSTNSAKLVYIDEEKYVAYLGKNGNPVSSYTESDTQYGRRMSFDMNTNRLYCQAMSTYDTPKSPLRGWLINDFNNDALYKGNHFKGFTTGEVFLSFYFENYVASSSQVIIHGIGEYTVEDIISWDNKEYNDTNAPYFTTDFEATDNSGVYASLGDTVVIPEVKAWDVNLVGDIAVNVYRNYDTENKSKVTVKNGKFVVSAPDVYTIEYKQRDASGNVGIYTIPVNVVSDGVGKSIVVNTEKLTTVNAGSTVQLPAYTVSSLNNVDAFNLKITAKSDKETINVNTETMSFVPMYSGTYTLIYEFNDNFGFNTFSYDFESVANDTSAIYKELPSLPKYFIKGQKYNIEQAFAYRFVTGAPEKENAEMYAVFDNSGTKVKIDNPKYTEITGNETVYFVYSLNGVEYTTDIIPIIDVTYYKDGAPAGIDMYKYFVGNFNYDDWNEDTNMRESNIVYYAKAGEDNMKMEFINSVNYDNFSFKYLIRDAHSYFNTITFKLTGVANPEQVLEVSLTRSADSTDMFNLYVNGEFIKNLTGYWSESKTKTFGYSKETNLITIANNTLSYPYKFDGNLVNFEVTISDIYGVAGLMVSNVCNQKFSGTTYKDTYGPLAYVESTRGEYLLGEKVTLNLPVFSDVLSQVNPDSLKFTVLDSEGNPAVSVDNVKLNGVDNVGMGVQYTIAFDKLTTYHVKYFAEDYQGNPVNIIYVMEVVDGEPPVVTLVGVENGKTYEVNKWGVFNFEYKVSDNISIFENIYVSVVLYETETNIWRTDVGTSIQFYKAGLYRVEVIAEDEAGNISSSTVFYINAK